MNSIIPPEIRGSASCEADEVRRQNSCGDVLQLMKAADYLRVLRPLLPAKMRTVHWGAYAAILFHLMVIIVCLHVFRTTEVNPFLLVLSLVMGHSLACLAFLAHEIAHGAIVGRRSIRYALELLLWGLNSFPATLWRRIHNETHHAETNTVRDPDRQFRSCESTSARHLFNTWLMANRSGLKWRPTVLLNFTTYILRHVASALGPSDWKAPFTVVKPKFRRHDRLTIIFELVLIGIIQSLMLSYAWVSPWSVIFVLVVPLLVSSAVVMMYIFTNHFLNPLCEHTDPLLGSTSVIVPKWMDFLHSNFSYHTEHHLFPGINPIHYPEVSRLLQLHFPDRYNRIPLAEAWRRLWSSPEFMIERKGAAHSGQ